MKGLRRKCGVVLAGVACIVTMAAADVFAETFTGTATVKTAGGATATAPVTVTVDRVMTQQEADSCSGPSRPGAPPACTRRSKA